MRSAAAAVVLLATSSFCLAQAPEGTPIRIRGTIERLEDSSLLVMTRNGQNVSIAIPDGLVVSGVVAKRLADIKEGDYVASTSIRGPDGKLRALEVHYLPQGAAQGQFPYDLEPDSLMTNAIVSGISAAADGRVLRVTYKGTQAEIVVPPDAPIVAFVPGDVSLLKPGASVVISASRMSDGTLRAARVTAEKDGVKPPM